MSFRYATRLAITALAAAMLPFSALAQPRGASTIEAAGPGKAYDYIIHVQNTYDYRYNPGVRADRILLARQIVRPFCSRNQIVGEDEFNPEILGLITGRLEYVVYIRCLSPPKRLPPR